MSDINVGLTAQPRDENYVPIQNSYRKMASGTGTVTISGTPVQVTTQSTQAKIIDIINPVSNADVIVIGASNVSYSGNIGIPIEPGFTYRVPVTDLSLIWVDAAGNGYKFQYNYFY